MKTYSKYNNDMNGFNRFKWKLVCGKTGNRLSPYRTAFDMRDAGSSKEGHCCYLGFDSYYNAFQSTISPSCSFRIYTCFDI